MIVERVKTAAGSYIDPPLDQLWTPLQKLEWQAAVVHADSGLSLTVADGGYSRNGVRQHGYYNIRYDSGSIGPYTYYEAWTFLNGVSLGAELAGRSVRA